METKTELKIEIVPNPVMLGDFDIQFVCKDNKTRWVFSGFLKNRIWNGKITEKIIIGCENIDIITVDLFLEYLTRFKIDLKVDLEILHHVKFLGEYFDVKSLVTLINNELLRLNDIKAYNHIKLVKEFGEEFAKRLENEPKLMEAITGCKSLFKDREVPRVNLIDCGYPGYINPIDYGYINPIMSADTGDRVGITKIMSGYEKPSPSNPEIFDPSIKYMTFQCKNNKSFKVPLTYLANIESFQGIPDQICDYDFINIKTVKMFVECIKSPDIDISEIDPEMLIDIKLLAIFQNIPELISKIEDILKLKSNIKKTDELKGKIPL